MEESTCLRCEPVRLLLLDMCALLCDIEWGGVAYINQCVVCGARHRSGREGSRGPRGDCHRAGCRQKSTKRRIDAMLRILDSKGG